MQLGRDLARVIELFRGKWRATRVALVGYSFGADVLPFAFNRLPVSLRREVSLVALMGFSGKADFQIRVTGWLGLSPSSAALPALPELSRMEARKVQCFYGADERDSACPILLGKGAEVIETGGGHHFGGDYASLAERITQGLARRS